MSLRSAFSAAALPARRPSSFFSNTTAAPELYTLSLHDALPISDPAVRCPGPRRAAAAAPGRGSPAPSGACTAARSEEHTSELQSRGHLVCRLLLEKKKENMPGTTTTMLPSTYPRKLVWNQPMT